MRTLSILTFILVTILPAKVCAQSSLEAKVLNGTVIRVSWDTDSTDGTYRVYRSSEPHFSADAASMLAETSENSFTDNNVETNHIYYYQVIASASPDNTNTRPAEVRAETFDPAQRPSIRITKANTKEVKIYEKFELVLDLEHVYIHNPYDPADIDVFALFTSPSGNTVRINGFYDNYLDTDQWKLRFSPNEVGQWQYRAYVRDAAGLGESEVANFTAVSSGHHGWIRPSDSNPHYFEHDDGTSYYAIGVYSPWRNDDERFATFEGHDANLFAIWDIGYGGFVNETGIIEEELGRYNQEKLGRLDSLMVILEERDIKLMYAIWPHDLFSETVWAAEWDKNPYNQLIDAEDVYGDPLVWEYQTRKYRYLVARYGYSRSMGIWEIINEMNGTDGWAKGHHQEAFDWVTKVDKWFEENDPYGHPTTASFSGGFGEYREPLYGRNDIPNIHVYPEQGWAMKYPDDIMRSAMYNYAWASRRFWNNFNKPAIFGEAGADLSYFENKDPKYHDNYHNVIWATLTNGLAGIPVWWQYPHLSERDWDHMKYLAEFVRDIDFANAPYTLAEVTADGADVFALEAGTEAFGWIRSYSSDNIAGTDMTLAGMCDGSYDLVWYNTWTGTIVEKETARAHNGTITISAPKLDEAHPDIAFKIRQR